MTKSPVAKLLASMLRQNKKLTEEQIERCVPMVVTRIVGFIHNAVQVRLLRAHQPRGPPCAPNAPKLHGPPCAPNAPICLHRRHSFVRS